MFADDIGLLAPGQSVREVCRQLQRAAEVAIEWGLRNIVQFDVEKIEAVLFTQKHGRELRDQVQRAQIIVGGQRVHFNQEATRWLSIWLDTNLTLKAHYYICLREGPHSRSPGTLIMSELWPAPWAGPQNSDSRCTVSCKHYIRQSSGGRV